MPEPSAPRTPLAEAARRAGLGTLAAIAVIALTIILGWDAIVEYNGKETELRPIAKLLVGEFVVFGAINFFLLMGVWRQRRAGGLRLIHALPVGMSMAFVSLASMVMVGMLVENMAFYSH